MSGENHYKKGYANVIGVNVISAGPCLYGGYRVLAAAGAFAMTVYDNASAASGDQVTSALTVTQRRGLRSERAHQDGQGDRRQSVGESDRRARDGALQARLGMVARSKAVDWVAIEAEYRAGIRPLREIGKAFGVSHVAIQKRADRERWPRDLKAKIRAKAEEKVTKAAVTSKVTLVTEKAIVEANASMQAQITLEHRADVRRARATLQALTEELEAYGVSRDQLETLAEVAAKQRMGEEADPKALAKAIDTMLAGTSFPARVGAAHKLADALVKCVTLERTVAGISDDERRDGDVASALEALAAAAVPDHPIE